MLNTGASYPAITVTVNVAANPPAQVTNQVSASGGGSATANASDPTTITSSASQALRFVPVTPCRVVDTRNPNGTFGGPAIADGGTRNFPVTASTCGIPANAVSYSLNVTVVPSDSLGFITVWPSGQGQPTVSTLNSVDGRVKAAMTAGIFARVGPPAQRGASGHWGTSWIFV